ncbi:MAG: alpha/beta fold hydrolase [Verrucomicrobiae bacterium]|nr:alpha/beta fold hydrolase [Verrucomicrobiae bacterium]
MIQGVGVTGEGWRPLVDELARDHSVLFFDHRGIGRSVPCGGPITIEAMAGDAAALMEAAGWRSAHVVGHSMGGVVAQQLALDHPGRVRSLSLLCTFARGRDGARLTPWSIWMGMRTRLGTRGMRRRAFLGMLMSRRHRAMGDLDAVAGRVAAWIGRDLAEWPGVVGRQVGALRRHGGSGRLGELEGIPTWVLSAAEDPIAPPRYGRRLAELIRGARYEEMEDASHGVILFQGAEVGCRMRQFIAASSSGVLGREPGGSGAPIGGLDRVGQA